MDKRRPHLPNNARTCLPEIKGVGVNVTQSVFLLLLYGLLEEAHRLLSGDFDSKHTIRFIREYPAVQCDKLWWLG